MAAAESSSSSSIDLLTTSELETEILGDLTLEPHYIHVRNTILQAFTNAPNTQLELETMKTEMEKVEEELVAEVFDFLVQYGFVNHGICKFTPKPSMNSSSRKKVIVLGSGLAGIACARQLSSMEHQVILLGGGKRNDGFSHSEENGLKEGLGSNLTLVEASGKHLKLLCRQGEIETQKITPDSNDDFILYDNEGELSKEDNAKGQHLFSFMVDILSVFCNKKEASILDDYIQKMTLIKPDPFPQFTEKEMKDKSLGEIISLAIDSFGLELNEKQTARLLWDVANLEYSCNSNISKLTLNQWSGMQDEIKQKEYQSLQGNGYTTLLEKLTETMKEHVEMHLEKQISKVQWSKATGIIVTAEDGSMHEAEILVCALPLEVLQNGGIIFEPSLPTLKKDVINKLHCQQGNQVLLKFSTQFWKEDVNAFGFVRPKSYEQNLLKEDNLRGEGFLFWNLQPLKEKPILAAFFSPSGDETQGSEEEMKNKTLDILKKIFGDEIPEPEESCCTKWLANPFTKDYSFLRNNSSSKNDIENLRKPVDEMIFFVANKESLEYQDMVVGPYESGLRVAADIENIGKSRRKRKAPESFDEPPTKKQMKVDPKVTREMINNLKIFGGDIGLKNIKNHINGNAVKIDPSLMQNQMKNLLNGTFAFNTIGTIKLSTAAQVVDPPPLTESNPWNKRPAVSPITFEDPSLPQVQGYESSGDEDIKAPTPTMPVASATSKPPKTSIEKKEKKSSGQYKQQAHSRIEKYVGKCLTKYDGSSSKGLTKEIKKKIVKKSSKKVYEDFKKHVKKKRDQGKDYDHKEFFTTKRKNAMRLLVKKYIKQLVKK